MCLCVDVVCIECFFVVVVCGVWMCVVFDVVVVNMLSVE